MKTHITAILVAALLAGACDLDVKDLNNPGIDQLEDDPTPSAVSAALTGLMIGNRRNTAAANGYVSQLGILGRESYNFDQADPRYINELLDGELAQGSPFGGNFWTNPYANLRLAEIVIRAIDLVPDYSEEERHAIRGFVRTIQAQDLLEVVVTRDTNGAVIVFGQSLDEELPPLVDVDEGYAKVVELLEDGNTELEAAGPDIGFPFELTSGYDGFDTPMTYRQVNRALRARVAAYLADYDTVLTALGESFLNADPAITLADLDVGAYHTYSTGAGDAVNNLINPNIFAHPTLRTDAEPGDARLTRKTVTAATPGAASGLSSDLDFTIYASASSSVPIIRNEELILLRAEANILGTPDLAAAKADLDLVRAVSGGLPPLATGADATLEQLFYERRYSLMFEGGFQWIDARRWGFEQELLDRDPGRNDAINIRYPIPLAECNGRGGPEDEPRCTLGSRD